MLTESDLKDMGVDDEGDRSKILEAADGLPRLVKEFWSKRHAAKDAAAAVLEAKSKSIADLDRVDDGDDGEDSARHVEDWLTSIGLACYVDTFRRHLYTDLERIARIWEVELTAVLEISKPGHRRRILSSVATGKSQLLQAVSVDDGLNDIGHNNDRLDQQLVRLTNSGGFKNGGREETMSRSLPP